MKSSTKYTIGISPCPNDTYIFYALLQQKIDTKGLEFEVHFHDVEELNQLAFQNTYDITKLSYHSIFHLQANYNLLQAGSALGNNCGPLLIAKKPIEETDINKLKIAIPGELTTANFLLKYAYPDIVTRPTPLLFSESEAKVLDGTYDAGVIIHENRFTYHERGLHLLKDLGEHWETSTKAPIPLGGITTRSSITIDQHSLINQLIVDSINYANNNPEEVLTYCKQYAQEMDNDVMLSHINLYVNNHSIDLGKEGQKAIEIMFKTLSK